MKQRQVSLLLLAASVITGALLLVPKRSSHVPEPARGDAASSGSLPEPAARTTETVSPASPPKPGDAGVSDEPTPADGVALRAAADRLISDGQVREGLDVFRKAVEADPSAKNHGDLGSLLYRLTAFDEAAIHLRAAAELDPGNADRWIALANLYYRKVDLGEAWKAEKRAREAEPGLELGRDLEGMRVRKGGSTPPNP
jgi:tetratricopeptide (TPR) repeat protein